MVRGFKKAPGESAREYAIRAIKSSIVNLNLEPGQSVSEQEIASELGVSRTPVREAFIKLAQEELIEIYPQKGSNVTLIDLDIVAEANFLRTTLEEVVVKLACQEMNDIHLAELEVNLRLQNVYFENKDSVKLLELDNQFHQMIFSACKKERIFSIMRTMNVHCDRVRMLRLAAHVSLDKILLQHREIFSAIKQRNCEKAEQVMAMHLAYCDTENLILKEQYPDYFKK